MDWLRELWDGFVFPISYLLGIVILATLGGAFVLAVLILTAVVATLSAPAVLCFAVAKRIIGSDPDSHPQLENP